MKKNPEIFKKEILENVKKVAEYQAATESLSFMSTENQTSGIQSAINFLKNDSIIEKRESLHLPEVHKIGKQIFKNVDQGTTLEKMHKLALEHKKTIVGKVDIYFIFLHRT